MNSRNDTANHCCSHHHSTVPSVTQTLDELDFERGVWSQALNGEYDRVLKYLNKGGDPNARDSSTYTALHYAARNGHIGVTKLLVQGGARVNSQTNTGGVTPLQRASYCGHTEIVDFLLQNGADPKMTDKDGKNSLHKGAEGNKCDVIRILVKKCPELLHIKDNRGKLPYEYCKSENILAMITPSNE